MREDSRSEPVPSAVSFRRVMVCLDGSDLGERSVPHAVAIAGALGASVTLLRVLERAPTDQAPADPLQWEMQRREAREYMDHVATPFRAAKTVIETELIEGKAAEEICRWCADRDVDLTVATTHGAGGPSPWALASTARKLFDRAPGSLLIVPSTSAEPAEGGVRYRRVLVPLDGSPQAETALPVAERIALAHHAELLLAHVVPVPELTQTGRATCPCASTSPSCPSGSPARSHTCRTPSQRSRRRQAGCWTTTTSSSAPSVKSVTT